MNTNDSEYNRIAVNRLTALWALNESGLGGILHAAKFPFTGILVGGFAVILISLTARYANYNFKTILKATAMVLMVKAAVSPHSPFPAYLAVSFQGLLGATLFSVTRNFKIVPVVFGGLALLESAIQKILLTVLFFGMSFWKSLDVFMNDILKIFNLPLNFSFSQGLAIVYVLMYFIIGISIGLFVIKIPQALRLLDFSLISLDDELLAAQKKTNRKKLYLVVLFFSIAIALFFPFDWIKLFPIGQLLLRVVFFMLLFYHVIGPITTKLIMYLSRNRSEEISKLNEDVAQLRLLVRPVLNYVNKNYNGINRIKMFVLYMIAISLNERSRRDA